VPVSAIAKKLILFNLCKRKALSLLPFGIRPTPLARPFFSQPVNPVIAYLDGSNLVTTPLGYAMAPFDNWGGDLMFSFTFYGSAFHRGTIRIVYDPLGTDTPTNIYTKSTNYLLCTSMELSGTTKIDFCVPWSKTDNFINCLPSSAGLSGVTLDKPIRVVSAVDISCNGKIYAFIETPLTCNSFAAPINFTVELSACPNIRYFKPMVSNIAAYYPIMQSGHDDVMSKDIYKVSGGENITDMKQLTKIMSKFIFVFLTPSSGVAPTIGLYYQAQACIPAYPTLPTVDSFTAGPNLGYSNGGNYITWFETLFRAQRGGYRAGVAFTSVGVNSTFTMGLAEQNIVVSASNVNWNIVTAPSTAKPGVYSTNGTIAGLCTPISCANTVTVTEVELPSLNPQNYRNCNACAITYFKNDSPQPTFTAGGPVLVLGTSYIPPTNLAYNAAEVYYGTADDYSLYSFDIVPLLATAV